MIKTEDPQLRSTLKTLQWRVVELQSVLDATRFSDRARAEIASIELASAQSEAIREQERASRLVATSGAEGAFLLAKSEDLPGRFYREGEVLGYVTPPSSNIARIVVPQDDVELVRNRLRSVSVKLAQNVMETYPAILVREAPAGRNELPSKALGTSGGGASAVDPGDQRGRKTLQRIFQFDLELPGTPSQRSAAVSMGRFEHEWNRWASNGSAAFANCSWRASMFEAILPSRELWPGAEAVGPYAERVEAEQSRIDRFISEGYAALGARLKRKGGAQLRRVADAIDAAAFEFAATNDAGLLAAAGRLRAELTRHGFERSIVSALDLIRNSRVSVRLPASPQSNHEWMGNA